MSGDKIITGQRVTAEKLELAKELRRNMTPAERALWQELRGNRLHGRHFRRQQIIDGFIVDFYCHQAALIIEVDGPIHETQKEADAEREAILSGRGLTILRFTNRQVMNNMNQVLRQIRESLDIAPADPPPNPLPNWEGEPCSSCSEDNNHIDTSESTISPPRISEEPAVGSSYPEENSHVDNSESTISPPRVGEGPGEGS